jgi:drug/metabolite transporter (DMT)-like permease
VLAALRFDIASQSKYHLAPKSFDAFLGIGGLRGLGALLSLMAFGVGTVVVVSPIVATTPLWNLLIAYLFLEGREKLNVRSALGTLAVVGGTIAITLGR